METTISLSEFSNAARNAFYWSSMEPEKRGAFTIADHEKQLNADLENMPEEEAERYISNYKKYFSEWLLAHSNCASSAITGGSGFNVSRAEKANNRERAKYNEFMEWRGKFMKAINKRVEDSKPQQIKDEEQFNNLKMQVDRLFDGFLVDRFRSRLETVAKTGNVELIRSVLVYFDEQQKERGRVLATTRHGVWKVEELAEKYRKSIESAKTAESVEYEINSVRVVRNQQADRLQLFFDGKPESQMISKLKQAAFRWSPSNGCWQRQLTPNAINAANYILK